MTNTYVVIESKAQIVVVCLMANTLFFCAWFYDAVGVGDTPLYRNIKQIASVKAVGGCNPFAKH